MSVIFFELQQISALNINIFRNTALRINHLGRLGLHYAIRSYKSEAHQLCVA